jgi:hypothetical protein
MLGRKNKMSLRAFLAKSVFVSGTPHNPSRIGKRNLAFELMKAPKKAAGRQKLSRIVE